MNKQSIKYTVRKLLSCLMRQYNHSPNRQARTNDFQAPGPITRPVRRAAAVSSSRYGVSRVPVGQATKHLKIAADRYQPVKVEPLSNLEMFHKANYSLVDMMKMKKQQIDQLNQQKLRKQAAGQEVSAMLTPIHTESQRTMQMSQISTPKLTPLKKRYDANGCQISILNISDLEGKIKQIEN